MPDVQTSDTEISDGEARDRKPLIALMAAGAISMSGNKMLDLAIPWFVLQTTGSIAKTGLTAFFTLLPTVLAGFLGGPIVDRLGFKRTSIVSDAASAVSVALIPLLHATIGLEFWQLLGLVFAGAALDAPGTTARYSMLPDVAARAGASMDKAAAWHDAVSRSSTLSGPPIAGILIAVIGAQNVLWVDAATFLVSIALVAVAIPSKTGERSEADEVPYLESLKQGLRFVAGDRLLLIVILTVTVTNVLDAIIGLVLLPAYFKEIFRSSVGLGLTFGAFGAGALIGALIYGAVGDRFSRRRVFAVSFLIVSVRSFVYVPVPPLWILMAAVFLIGVGCGPLNPILTRVEMARAPVEMRGRVIGAIIAIAWGAMPLGALVGGFVVEAIGIKPALVAVGLLYVAVTLTLTVNPGVRDLDRISDTPSP